MIAETVSATLPPVQRSAAFDAIAGEYDQVFTHSALGTAHRSLVHEVLRRYIRKGQRIVDLNCGTGEDAIYLASQGMFVVGCDISGRMVEIARQKARESGYGSAICLIECANEGLESLAGYAPFDAALSNFGGLNCSADPAQVARGLAPLVRPGGEVLVCMIGRVCAWEIAWYAARGNWRKGFRRLNRGGASANLGGASVQVRYPKPRDMRKAFAPWFRLEAWRGIGVVLPPSWLAARFEARPRLVAQLRNVDRLLGPLPIFRGIADHNLFRFVREDR